MVSKPDLYSAASGFSIANGAALLSSIGPPGGDGSFQDDALLGSIYLRTDIGTIYLKTSSNNNSSDWEIILSSDTLTYSAQNGTGFPLVIGTPVIVANNIFTKADASTFSNIRVAGLILDTSIASNATGFMQSGGIFTATTNQWDAIAGTTGGLTPGPYYLSTVSGKLTSTPPTTSGHYVVEVGLAISANKMRIQIQSPLAL